MQQTHSPSQTTKNNKKKKKKQNLCKKINFVRKIFNLVLQELHLSFFFFVYVVN